jgi:hypothetical protein
MSEFETFKNNFIVDASLNLIQKEVSAIFAEHWLASNASQ